jgi:hypothetical protein
MMCTRSVSLEAHEKRYTCTLHEQETLELANLERSCVCRLLLLTLGTHLVLCAAG